MKKIVLTFFIPAILSAQITVNMEVNETPAVNLGFAILSAIPNDSSEITDDIKTWKWCFELAFDGAMTESCKAITSAIMAFDEVDCSWSGAFTGPAACTVRKVGSAVDVNVTSKMAQALLAAFTAGGAGIEGAAGTRHMVATNIVLDFNLAQFDGGGGAKVTFDALQWRNGKAR